MMETSRNYSIDLIKVIAMYGVLCLHTHMQLFEKEDVPFCLAYFLFYSANICMPLFFMASGCLILPRGGGNLSDNQLIKYSAKKIVSILKFVFIVTVSYTLLFTAVHYIKHCEINYNWIFTTIFGWLVQKGSFSIFWYFAAMICIYALLPLLSKLYNNTTAYICTLCILFLTIYFVFTIDITTSPTFSSTIYQPYRLWTWLFYFLLGGLVPKFKHCKQVYWRWGAFLLLFSILINILYVIYTKGILIREWSPEYYQVSLPCVVLSFALFVFVYNLDIKHNKLLAILSNLFLPIYTLHIIVILYASSYFYDRIGYNVFTPIIYWIFTSIFVTILAYLIMKIPICQKVFKL